MTEQHSDPRDFLPLHPLDFRVLMVLLGGPAHGYRIVKTIEEQEQQLPSIHAGNLYRRIRDLLAKGLLEEVDPPHDGDSDPRRKYFQPTSLGAAVTRAEARRLATLAGEAQALGITSNA